MSTGSARIEPRDCFGPRGAPWDNRSAPEGAGNTTPGLDPHHLYDRKC